jgi:hypothetical protein
MYLNGTAFLEIPHEVDELGRAQELIITSSSTGYRYMVPLETSLLRRTPGDGDDLACD